MEIIKTYHLMLIELKVNQNRFRDNTAFGSYDIQGSVCGFNNTIYMSLHFIFMECRVSAAVILLIFYVPIFFHFL